jgi:hypothetical protein
MHFLAEMQEQSFLELAESSGLAVSRIPPEQLHSEFRELEDAYHVFTLAWRDSAMEVDQSTES